MRDKTPKQVFGLVVIADYRPHSSSVTACGGDSFPPGEAFGAPAPVQKIKRSDSYV